MLTFVSSIIGVTIIIHELIEANERVKEKERERKCIEATELYLSKKGPNDDEEILKNRTWLTWDEQWELEHKED